MNADRFVAGSSDPSEWYVEVLALRARLAEAEEALAALRSGAADALHCDTGVLYRSGADSAYVAFFNAMNEGGATLDGNGTILYCNPRFSAMTGRPADELRGRALLSCVIEPDRPPVAALLEQDGAGTCEATLDGDGAGHCRVRLALTPLDANQRRFGCLVVTDLTRRARPEHELELLVEERVGELRLAASVFENTLEGVVVTNMDSVIVSVNPAFSAITGYSSAEAIGQKVNLLRSQRHPPEFYCEIWHALGSDGRWRGQIWNRRKNGEAYLQWTSISLVPAHHGQPASYVGVFTDITDTWRKDARIAHLAYHDPLTDLPNRNLLLDRLAHALSVAERRGDRLGVLFIDLDGFKAVNDNLGHHVGDRLLQQTARRLAACVRSCDTVARFGGDEFVVLMEKLDSVDDCTILAERLPASLSCECEAPMGNAVRVGASVGIAIYPDDGADAASLLRNADAALYAAKGAGKGTVRYFGDIRSLGILVSLSG